MPADYESDDTFDAFNSQDGKSSYVQLSHGLGSSIGHVQVMITQNTALYVAVYYGTGSAQNCDSSSTNEYGGVVYGYNSEYVIEFAYLFPILFDQLFFFSFSLRWSSDSHVGTNKE